MRISFIFAVLLLVLPVAYSVEYVIGDAKEPVEKGDPDAVYVGAEKCKMCHKDKYDDWKTSGHPYKLLTPEEAKAIRPDIPLPEGYTWDDIQYVIGGWGWKSRYIGKDGFIITKTKDGQPLEKNQYNWQDGSWSSYHSGENKTYNCQRCHNTGAAYEEGTHQDGLEGIEGTWEFRGVQCEACHGPGSKHVEQGGGRGVAIVVDKSAELCGKCHVRGDNMSAIPSKGGFIRHHEQYQELKNGGMSALDCTTCHDPHKAVHEGATNPEGHPGIIKKCEDCHAEESEEFIGSIMQKDGVTCTDCHMPKVTKSAINVSDYEGDVNTHIFRIDTRADAKMFTTDGKSANGYLTLEYTCLKCHLDKDKTWAAKYASEIHSFGKAVEIKTPATTAAPATTPAPTAKGGICGPTAVLLAALLPLGIMYWLRRRG